MATSTDFDPLKLLFFCTKYKQAKPYFPAHLNCQLRRETLEDISHNDARND